MKIAVTKAPTDFRRLVFHQIFVDELQSLLTESFLRRNMKEGAIFHRWKLSLFFMQCSKGFSILVKIIHRSKVLVISYEK